MFLNVGVICLLFWLLSLGDIARVRGEVGTPSVVIPVVNIPLVNWPCPRRRSAYLAVHGGGIERFCVNRSGRVWRRTR